jgi:hypothetical protein
MTLNKGVQNKNIEVDVSGVNKLGIKLNNIQNEDTKKGYDVFYSVYPQNIITIIDPMLSKLIIRNIATCHQTQKSDLLSKFYSY